MIRKDCQATSPILLLKRRNARWSDSPLHGHMLLLPRKHILFWVNTRCLYKERTKDNTLTLDRVCSNVIRLESAYSPPKKAKKKKQLLIGLAEQGLIASLSELKHKKGLY